jgi:UDP-N-acetylglucosamine 2-epimerase (non-hydrolysing)
LHVDDPCRLSQLFAALEATSQRLPVIFPVHPRTRVRLAALGLEPGDRLRLCEPQPYTDFLSLLTGARLVLTDSGGIQEETTILRVPCLTLRENTERPVTIELGTNRLLGTNAAAILREVDLVLAEPMPDNPPPPLWDGAAAERIVSTLERLMQRAPASIDRGAAAAVHV